MSSARPWMDVPTSASAEDATGRIIASLPGVFYLFRAADGCMLRWNGLLEQRTGRDSAGIGASHPLDLVAPPDQPVVAAAIDAAIREGSSDCEAHLLATDGKATPYYFYGQRVEIDGIECVSGLGVDISARHEARAEAERMRQRLIDAVEAMPDGFAYYDADDSLQLCNARYRDLVKPGTFTLEPGHSFRHILRLGLQVGLYPEGYQAPERWLEDRLQRRREHDHDQFEQRISTGQWLRVEEHPTADGGRVSILVDITAYKEREARLRESEQRYRALFNNEADAIVISEVESGRLLDINQRAEAMFGHDRFTLLGLTRLDLHPQATRTRAEAAYTARCQQPNATPFRQQILGADGTTVPVEISATVVEDVVRDRRLIQAVIRDVTQRDLLEQMNADRALVLESIARRAPLSEVLRKIRRMLEHLGAVRSARVLVARDDRLVDVECLDGMSLDASVLEQSSGSENEEERLRLPSEAANAMQVADDGGEDALEILHDGEGNVVGALAMVLPGEVPEAPHPLRSAVIEATGLAAIAIEQQNLADRLSWQAGHDALTALPNRTLLMDRLQQAMARSNRNNGETSVMLLDLDDFKRVNDTLGHRIGDDLLRAVADRLQACLRAEDTVARLGGDEFVLVLPTAGAREAARVADKIVRLLSEPVTVQGHPLFATPSIGISVHPHDSSTADGLLQYADAAMYAAKHAGKRRYEFHAG